MNKRFISVLIFAICVSAIASFVMYKAISVQVAASSKSEANTLVLAVHDLPNGSLIREEDVKLGPWAGPAPAGSFTQVAEVTGRGVVQPIYAGEPLVENRIAMKGAGAGLAATIPPGMRAVAVRVNEVVGVAGFVTPGMKVDVLIAGNPPNNAASNVGTLAKTLLQNIEVLSAGQNIQKDAEGKPVNVPVVNLLVTPEQAEVLSLASNETRIQLVLRNPTDKDKAETPGTAVAYLFTGINRGLPADSGAPLKPLAPRPVKKAAAVPPPPPPPPPPAVVAKEAPAPPPPVKVEVIHGSRRSEMKFEPPATPVPEVQP